MQWENPNAKVIIGNFCSIGDNLKVYLGNGVGHDINFVSTYPFGYTNTEVFPNVVNTSRNTNGNVIINNDIWIGENVTLMSGINIRNGAVIAANSHVVKNVEPYSVVGGNPAQHIKYRFTKEQIEALLKIEWWNWTIDKINKYTHLLSSYNIDDFIVASKLEDILDQLSS
jgi:virginiamycin A acetyltransferase